MLRLWHYTWMRCCHSSTALAGKGNGASSPKIRCEAQIRGGGILSRMTVVLPDVPAGARAQHEEKTLSSFPQQAG
jgi:hypothetical protein